MLGDVGANRPFNAFLWCPCTSGLLGFRSSCRPRRIPCTSGNIFYLNLIYPDVAWSGRFCRWLLLSVVCGVARIPDGWSAHGWCVPTGGCTPTIGWVLPFWLSPLIRAPQCFSFLNIIVDECLWMELYKSKMFQFQKELYCCAFRKLFSSPSS